MTAVLAAHLVLAVGVLLLGRAVGLRVFLLAAVLPTLATVWFAARTGPVLAGEVVTGGPTWASALGLDVALRLDGLGLVLALLITGVGAGTLVYARWYFADRREGVGRLAATLLVFVGAMLLVVLADNLLTLYVAWELTTVCSFLLIGDDGRSDEARRAALRALLVTTGAGLVMLLGFLVLGHEAGTYRISSLVADPPSGSWTATALVLVLVGAFAKCAQVPFHPWLSEAMIAPTPVSAYLHAAAMVKAGVYLVARLAPGFAEVVPWQPLVAVVGLTTMLVGGWRALAQTDLKRLLAFGTVAQLGLLVVLLGVGTRTAALAGVTLLVAHALFKACLFLVVGIVDRSAGTRDLTELAGVGRRAPVLLLAAALASGSMVGLPPFVGYLGKEAALEAFHAHAYGGPAALVAVAAGSVLTVAYTCRFLWAFGGNARAPTDWRPPAKSFAVVPLLLAGAGLLAGLLPGRVDALAAAHADTLPGPGDYHLALWHGIGVPSMVSVATLVAGIALFVLQSRVVPAAGSLTGPVRALAVQDAGARGAVACADRLTRHTHPRGLPAQLTRTVAAVTVPAAVALVPVGLRVPHLWDTPWQLVVAVGALLSSVGVIVVRRHLYAAVVLGVVGYLVALLFVLQGAPDLALTLILVETLTLVLFVLVVRRMPHGARPSGVRRPTRAVVAVAFGATMTMATLAMAGRHTPSRPSPDYLSGAPAHGGPNVVNVIITEYRALDTLGEVTVLVIAATTVASLVLRHTRMGGPPRPDAPGQVDPDTEDAP